jgi:hypothetical protein
MIENVMIPKDPGNVKIHRLCMIHIYKAAYILLLSIKWQQLLHNAEDKGLVNEGSYGSRPSREVRTVVFMEMMQMEISHSSCRPFKKFTQRNLELKCDSADSLDSKCLGGQ